MTRQFEEAGGRIVLVGMGTPEESATFLTKTGVGFPMISDPFRQLYQAYGLKLTPAIRLFSPVLTAKAISAMVQGNAVGKPIGDIRQLPGAFVLDTEGRIIYRHAARDAADHPDAEVLLAALRGLTAK